MRDENSEFEWVEFDDRVQNRVVREPAPNPLGLVAPEILTVAGFTTAMFAGMRIASIPAEESFVRETARGVTIVEGAGFSAGFWQAGGLMLVSILLLSWALILARGGRR